ncbi:zinc-binding dehydrogenase [uncultured Limosilactobacillus sp.]|uniref:zinc-binding dehydrogenase n=1 Tax=uncultured Limosilactobacillus sp. TaxID=2837629 RepID=UPI0025E6969C|nr:zinc-binding dehydrogenase [uncultured Limosilactobacillus sp.]
MKAAVLYEPGQAEQLKYVDVPTPDTKPGWSLIKVMGRGLTYAEVDARNGMSPTGKIECPKILGIECVGVIEKTTDPERLPVGQKAVSMGGGMGIMFDGSYADYTLLPNKQIVPIQSNLSWEDLAAISESYYTAYRSLLQLKIKDAKTLLVRAATSSVGLAALKLARVMNPEIKVFGTSRRAEAKQTILDFGFDGFVQDKDNELQTSDSYDAIFDLVGCSSALDSMKHLNPFGIVSVTGDMGRVPVLEQFNPIVAIPNDRYMTSFANFVIEEKPFDDLLKLIEDNNVDVSPVKVFHLKDIVEAHKFLEGHQHPGKVVVLP